MNATWPDIVAGVGLVIAAVFVAVQIWRERGKF
jgi:hypothetical protein